MNLKMNLKKTVLISAAILIVVVVAIYVTVKFKKKEKISRPDINPQMEEVYAEDRKALKNSSANQYQIFSALIRLAEQNDPIAAQEALKRAEDTEDWVRAGSAEALGFLKDEKSFEVLKKLLYDKSDLVRIRALKGLGHRKDESSILELEKILKRPALSGLEKIEATSSLIIISESPVRKQQLIDSLLNLGQKEKGEIRLNAIRAAASFAPTNQVILEILAQELNRSDEPRLLDMSIRHLAATAPNMVRAQMNNLKNNPDVGVRVAVLQTLYLACPFERWQILRDVLTKEKDPMVWTEALRAPIFMPGKKSLEFLESIRKDGNLNTTQVQSLDKVVGEIVRTKGEDPCLKYEKH